MWVQSPLRFIRWLEIYLLYAPGTGDEIMNVEPKTANEEGRVICKSKECRHLLSRQFIDYNWVTGMCPNPDCFYHSHPQEDVENKNY
jgi:hypothetical protein